mgnify:CR=1 FL=1
MANPESPTEKHPYKSNAADFYVDAPNYLAELICKKKHEDENTGALPRLFWRLPSFKNLYIREVSQAKNLLKSYDEKSVIQAMKSPKAKWIRSLRNKNLLPIIKEFEATREQTEFCAITQEFKIKRKKQFGTHANPLRGL